MSGIHKNGLGWNACGVFCGECNRCTCEGCPNERKPWDGLSQEIIDYIRREVNDDGVIIWTEDTE